MDYFLVGILFWATGDLLWYLINEAVFSIATYRNKIIYAQKRFNEILKAAKVTPEDRILIAQNHLLQAMRDAGQIDAGQYSLVIQVQAQGEES